MNDSAGLKRSLSLPLITLYGLGTILGAGVYVLIGKVAGEAALYAPVAFLLAAVIATVTAFAYAELAARYPQSAGEAVYVREAFDRRWLAAVVGYAVMLTGVVSAATLANGFVGYLDIFIELPDWLAITLLVFALGALAAWGVDISARSAALITLIEVGGLVFVLAVAGDSLGSLPQRWPELLPNASAAEWYGIAAGSVLAFYAFIGFEDMVNMAEEVREPERALPRGIFLALFAASGLYVLIALVAVLALPLDVLTASDAPLADLVAERSGRNPVFIAAISLIAVANGALVQIMMASRVLYGMGARGLGLRYFAAVNPRTRTPLAATAMVTAVVLILALWLPMVTLAEITSFIILLVFTLVNFSLWRLKKRAPQPAGAPDFPRWLPACGVVLCLCLASFQVWITVRA